LGNETSIVYALKLSLVLVMKQVLFIL